MIQFVDLNVVSVLHMCDKKNLFPDLFGLMKQLLNFMVLSTGIAVCTWAKKVLGLSEE
jgi:hypothetical protein